MIQQRKKDYLQRLIEEFFKKLQQAINENRLLSDLEQKAMLDECFDFYSTNFNASREDRATSLMEKINEIELLEQYAKLLMLEFDITEKKDKSRLREAFDIVDYIQKTDTTYSWERTVLREDLLHRLDETLM
ncbi:MAG: hypothetical protein LBN74_05670 [Prevotella sp.]|jgi:hypothetical protein|nr:hypothetical protein [Prevotella sp.]